MLYTVSIPEYSFKNQPNAFDKPALFCCLFAFCKINDINKYHFKRRQYIYVHSYTLPENKWEKNDIF